MLPKKEKIRAITARILINIQLRLVFTPCPNRVPARIPPIASKDSLDEASSPSVVQSLRTGSWSFGFTPCIIMFRLTTPLSQAPLLGQDELTRRKRDLDTRGHDRSLSHLALIQHHLIYIQIMVEASLFKQFFVASLLNDAAVLQNGDFIGIDDSL